MAIPGDAKSTMQLTLPIHVALIVCAPRRCDTCHIFLLQWKQLRVHVQMILKCADIGHLAASPRTHRRWAFQLEEEFFRQVLQNMSTLAGQADKHESANSGSC